MSEVLALSRPKFQLNILRLVSGIFFVITAVMSAFNDVLRDLPFFVNSWQGVIEFPASLALYHYVFLSVSLPLVCLALAVTGILAKSGKLWAIAAGVYFLLCWPLSFVMTWLLQNNFDFSHWQMLWTSNEILNSGSTITFIIASLLAVVSMFVKLGKPLQLTSENQISNIQPVVNVGAPISNLPIFALVGAFVVPLAGIIIGHISISQMNRGLISSQNRSMATIGMILGYVFTVLSIVIFIVSFMALIALNNTLGGY